MEGKDSASENPKWWAAHVVMYNRFRDGVQDYYAVMEDIYLVNACCVDEARKKASLIGKESELDSETYTCDGRPAVLEFAGIRRIVECDDSLRRPGDGTEVTYMRLIVETETDFARLTKGESVTLEYE